MGDYDEQLYSVELLCASGSDQVEHELAREDRSEVARLLYELMKARYPDRVIVLRVGEVVLDRSDR
jgi:hypothetical protein